jgi:hypothetical protein
MFEWGFDRYWLKAKAAPILRPKMTLLSSFMFTLFCVNLFQDKSILS